MNLVQPGPGVHGGWQYNNPAMAAVASVMPLLEEAAGRGSFRTEVNYHGRELTAREQQLCHLYRKYLQCTYVIARAEAPSGSYNTGALVARMDRENASGAMPLICNGLDSESEPGSSDRDDM